MFKLLKTKSPQLQARHTGPSPIDRFLSLTLAFAAQEQATAIVIGMPQKLPDSIGDEQKAEFLQDLTLEPLPRTAAERTGADLKSPHAWRRVPLWLRIRGQLYPTHSLPIETHITFLATVQDRLVRLDASDEATARFIEYPPDNRSERCFAQISLWFDPDNTIRLEIEKYLRCPFKDQHWTDGRGHP